MTSDADARLQEAVLDLHAFLEMTGDLSVERRGAIIERALVLVEETYGHLPLKRAVHAVDPEQSLRQLRQQVGQLGERQFHDAMISVFRDLRDLNTHYILPVPYRHHTAFLPFMIKEYYDAVGTRHYVVSRVMRGMRHATFVPGIEVTRWSGVPIDRAVALNADREAAGNETARRLRGLDAMTMRPMAMSLPPDAEWVAVGYVRDGANLEIRLPWRVYRHDASSITAGPDRMEEVISPQGLGLNMELTGQACRALFADEMGNGVADALGREKGPGAPPDPFLARDGLLSGPFGFGATPAVHKPAG